MGNFMLFMAKNPCDDLNVLRVVVVLKEILSVVFLVVPMILIVLVIIDIVKNVVAKSEEDMTKNKKLAIKRCVYAVAIFFVPTIVSIFMSALGDLGVDYGSCMSITKESLALKIQTAKNQCTSENMEWNEGLSECVEKKQYSRVDPNSSPSGGNGGLGAKRDVSNSNSESEVDGNPAAISVIYQTNDSYKSSLNTTNQRISAPFWDTVYHSTPHKGMDIAAPGGTEIIALGGGTVAESNYNAQRGWYIRIDHGNYCTLYQHMKESSPFKKGQTVKKGNVIGKVGSTGHSSGNHLHLELWVPSGQGKPNWNSYNAKWNVADPTNFDFTKLPD